MADDKKIQSPSAGFQIAGNILQAEQRKKQEAAKNAPQIQEQAKQQALRDQSQTQRRDQESLQKRDEKASREQHTQTQNETQVETKTKAEKIYDSFVTHSAAQRNLREAGKDLTRGPTWSSLTPQAWSVLNSKQLSPEARRNVMVYHQQRMSAQMQQAGMPAALLSLESSRFEASPLPELRPIKNFDEEAPLLIRYASPQPKGLSSNSLKVFSHTSLGDRLFQQLANMFNMPNPALPKNPAGLAPVLVQLRLPLVFVRDRDEMRVFRLKEDGELEELPTEHSDGKPLSPEAQAMLKKVLRQKLSQQNTLTETPPEMLLGEAAQFAQETAVDPKLDFEIKFSLLLYKVLEEAKSAEHPLQEGEDPHFPEKGDWPAFFGRMKKVGNQEKEGKKLLDDILGVLFRGAFKKTGQGMHLVGDLKYSEEGKTRVEKFVQILVGDEAFEKILQNLKPGQSLNLAWLKSWFDEELSYLQMAHSEEKLFVMGQQSEKDVLFNPRSSYDLYSQARLEASIFTRKSSDARSDTSKDEEPRVETPALFANVYELLHLKQWHEEHPRLGNGVLYLVFGSLGAWVLGYGIWKIL